MNTYPWILSEQVVDDSHRSMTRTTDTDMDTEIPMISTGNEHLREMIALIAMSEDTAEGLRAFQEDREPEWSGR